MFVIHCSEIEKQVVGILRLHNYLFKITQVSIESHVHATQCCNTLTLLLGF